MSVLKRFFVSMLGSMAAIWLSAILLIVLGSVFVLVAFAGDDEKIDVDDHSVLLLTLSGSVEERSVEPSLMDELYGNVEEVTPLNDMVNAIRAAAEDDRIEGIYIDAQGISAGIASVQSIQQVLKEFKKSGKWIVAYGDSYAQADYYISSIADELYLNPVGSVDVHGLSATTLFFKGLLDKVGVEMQVVKVGEFKSAVEPFIRTDMSEPSRLQQQVFLDNIWKDFSTTIAANRGVKVSTVNMWADSLLVCRSPEYCVKHKVIDKTSYRHQVEKLLKEKCGLDEDDDLRTVDAIAYAKVADIPHRDSEDNRIAVLYAVGDITESAQDGIASDRMVPMILNLAEDDKVRAMVLRVNSGGGSAFASEQIWEALQHFKETGKKLYVSMGDYAASGGYYISCGADKIYAQPGTLTGSIGIFGLIPCAKGLMNEHLGITSDNVSTNANGGFMSISEPLTPTQYNSLQAEINRGYETFVGRCAEGRDMSVADIKAIAEGRVWDGTEALRIGLVDKLGNLDECITDLAAELDLPKYQVIEYPRQNVTIWEMLFEQPDLADAAVKSSLGDSYIIYDRTRKLMEMAPKQCRMETIILR